MKARRIIRLLGWAVTREAELDALEMECRMLTNSVRSTAEAHGQLRDEYRKCMELMREQMRHKEEAQRQAEMERLRANKAEMERDQLADRLERAEAQVDDTERILQEMRHRLNSSNGRLGGYKKSWNHKEKKQQKKEETK
jgi:chromosome segregation ATPase